MLGFIASVLPDIGLTGAIGGITDALGITGGAEAAAPVVQDFAGNLGVDAATGTADAVTNSGIVDQAALDGSTAQGTLYNFTNGSLTPTTGDATPGTSTPSINPSSGIPSLPSGTSSTLKNIIGNLFGSGSGSGGGSRSGSNQQGLSLGQLAGLGGLGALLATQRPSILTPTGTGLQSITPSNFKWNAQPVQAPVNGVAYGQQILNPTFKHGGSVHHDILNQLHRFGHPINQETVEAVSHLVNRGEPAHHIVGFMHYRKKMAGGGSTGAAQTLQDVTYATQPDAIETLSKMVPDWAIPQLIKDIVAGASQYTTRGALGRRNDTPITSPQESRQNIQGYSPGMAAGGPLGAYSDGGHFLKGPGDGMSDDIPARIGHHQEARLANEEFVIPADVVSHLGNGSSEAGAKVLYKMMEKVRKARTGNPKQGKQINPNKFMPA
jgi:hypothetical protein